MGDIGGSGVHRRWLLILARCAVLAALVGACVGVPAALAWPEPVSQAPTVTITGFSPTSGAGGSTVTITGSGFTAAGINGVNNVGFDYNWAKFTIVSNTEITATVPTFVGAGYSGPIVVESTDYTPTLAVVSAGNFTVFDSPDPYNGVSPASGPPGTLVRVSGATLATVNSVSFNGESVDFVATDSQVTTQIPTDAATGAGTLTLTSPGGKASLTFTVAPGPHISSISPTSGHVGTTFVINGSNLTNTNQVTLNGSPVNFTVATDSELTVSLPSWASTGQVAVTTPAGTVTGPTFTVTAASTTTTTTSTATTTTTTTGNTTTSPSSGNSGSTSSGTPTSGPGSDSSGSGSTTAGSTTSGSSAGGTGPGSPPAKNQGVSVSAPVVTNAGGGEQAVAFSVRLNATTFIHIVLTAPSGKRVLVFSTRAPAGRTHFIRNIPTLSLKSGAPLTLRVSFTSHGKTHTTSVKLRV